MYEKAGKFDANEWNKREEFGIFIEGFITDKGNAMQAIRVDDTKFDPELGPRYHADCQHKVCIRDPSLFISRGGQGQYGK